MPQFTSATFLLLFAALLLVGVQAGDVQLNTLNVTCEDQREALDSALGALGGLGKINSLLSELRRLERKVSKLAKTLRKLGYSDLIEDDEGQEEGDTTDNSEVTRTIETTTPLPAPENNNIIFPTATEVNNNTTTEESLGSERLCPGGWTRIGEACYQFVTEEALAWANARVHCQQLGTDLAEMNTRGEQGEVTRYLNNYHYGIPFWLGGSLNKRGKWRWVWTESRVPARATKWGWAQGYPRTDDDLRCLVTRGRGLVGGDKTWEDGACDDKRPFICEYTWLQEIMEETQSGERR